jgi:light-regulated signal transduction histidine kinase (bacteriophytochrome)
MQLLIDDLLAYSRVGTRAKELKPMDMNRILDQALANLAMSILENKVQIIREDLPTLKADETQITLVFQNLIGNAVKFRGDKAPVIHISAEKDPNGWVFSISDNGIGISPDFHKRIFLIFQRLHTKDQYPGTGIGLAICKKIIDRHNGRIWVESAPGKGATFHFSLPD